MTSFADVNKKFFALQKEYETMRQNVALDTLHNLHDAAAKIFVEKKLEEMIRECEGVEGFFAQSVCTHLQNLQKHLYSLSNG